MAIDTTADSTASTARLQYIDGLRGIAVAMVVSFHAVVWGGFPMEGRFSFYFSNGLLPLELGQLRHIWSIGGAGVDLFLAISGFCLFWPLVKKGGLHAQPLLAWPYLQRRIKRICPPYYCAIANILVISYLTYQYQGPSWWPWYPHSFQTAFPWQGLDSWFNIATHLLLIHGFFNAHVNAYEGAWWSLSLEWQFYFLFIPLAFVARRFGVVWAAILPIATTILFRWVCLTFMPQFLSSAVGNAFCLNRWAEFGAGMLAAAIVSKSLPQRLVDSFVGLKRLKFFYLVSSIALAAGLEYTRVFPQLISFLWGNASLVCLTFGALSPGFRRFLEWRPLTWLGTISYSLYLTHGTVYMALATLLTRSNVAIETRLWIYLLAAPPLAVAFGALFFRAFEKPFLARAQHTRPSAEMQAAV